ncbi:MAG: PBECR2 nuclease fold domain-containing protein [bacterium]|nr:PBECR2 nuclease fold domain-containing protein [bacterium]
MLTPEYLAAVPDTLVQLYSAAELDILCNIARRISRYDFFIPAAAWQVRKLQAMGLCYEEIMSILSQLTRRSRPEIERLVKEAGIETLRADDAVYKRHGLNPPPVGAAPELQRILRSGIARTEGLFENLTRTTAQTATQQFEHALDRAWMQAQSGAFSYTEAIRNAVRTLAMQGIRSVSYAGNGRMRTETLEVAVRRAVITGINQTALQMQLARADEMGCDLVEVTAHVGARTGEGIANHAGWQGKVYSRSGVNPKYPHFATATGYGTGAGLGGWNCRHSAYAYFEGDPRAYTDERLREMEEETVTYNGEKMSVYDATRRQRAIERQIRRWKREFKALEAAGQDPYEAAAKLRKWQGIEKDFTAQTGLKRQSERTEVHGFERSEATRAVNIAKKVEKSSDPAIMTNKVNENSGAQSVNPVGKIDIEKYKCVSADIATDEVVITEKQIQHIAERHPNDYERFSMYFPQIVAEPDYILEANKPYTAVILKEIKDRGEVFKTVLRLAVYSDGRNRKNSIITFMRIDKKDFERLLRNKAILYKRE